MAKFTNPTPGARGVLLKDGTYALVEAGGSAEIADKDVENAHPDLVKQAPAKRTDA